MKKKKEYSRFKSDFLVLAMYFIYLFSIYIGTIALRIICDAMAAIAVKHIGALSE